MISAMQYRTALGLILRQTVAYNNDKSTSDVTVEDIMQYMSIIFAQRNGMSDTVRYIFSILFGANPQTNSTEKNS